MTDTHSVVKHLVQPHDSLLKKVNAPIEIRDYGNLEHYLQPLSRHKIPYFDFSKYYIVLASRCEQCLWVCRHGDNRFNQSCHRNACQYSPYWAVKERTHTHPLDYERVHINGISPLLRQTVRHDTLIVHEKNQQLVLTGSEPEYIFLHAILGGDCQAIYSYDLFQDDNKKTITWIIHNYYGECRSGRIEDVYLRIKSPGAGYHFIIQEVLEEHK